MLKKITPRLATATLSRASAKPERRMADNVLEMLAGAGNQYALEELKRRK